MTTKTTPETFLALEKHISKGYIDRNKEARALLLGLLTGQHVDFRGVPGTAKSALVRDFCGAIQGSTYFEMLCSEYSTREESEGPISIQALKEGKYERITAGRLPEAHVAFLDEAYKSSPEFRNTLLQIANERIYRANGGYVQCPLVTMVIASNEGPPEGPQSAFADRFLLRCEVMPTSESVRWALSLTTTSKLANS